jgi:hypothetical protein
MNLIKLISIASILNVGISFYLVYILGHRISKVQDFMQKLNELDYETNVFNIVHRKYKEKDIYKVFNARKKYSWYKLVFCIWINLDKCYSKEFKRSMNFLRPKMWGHWHG